MSAVPATTSRRSSGLRQFAGGVATIMVKELRSRFRGRRAFVVLTLYLGVLALLAYGVYTVVAPTARDQVQAGGGLVDPSIGLGFSQANASAAIGQAIFAMLSVFQLLLVAFIAPAFTAGTISLEREKQTLDLLITTPLRPGAIVVGKLLAALAFVFLMIVAAIPVSALVLMYGGAGIDDIIRQQVVLVVSAIGLGVIGLFWSALARRTQVATVLTYSTLLVLGIGTILGWRFWTEVATQSPSNRFGEIRRAPEQILWVNPAVAMIEVVANTELEYGDFSELMDAFRSSSGSAVPTPDVPVVRGAPTGVAPDDAVAARMKAAAIAAAQRQLRLGAAGPLDVPGDEAGLAAIAPQQTTLVSTHYLTRFAATFGALSLLLTLAAMRLVVPAGRRLGLRRRQRSVPELPAEGQPLLEEMEP